MKSVLPSLLFICFLISCNNSTTKTPDTLTDSMVTYKNVDTSSKIQAIDSLQKKDTIIKKKKRHQHKKPAKKQAKKTSPK